MWGERPPSATMERIARREPVPALIRDGNRLADRPCATYEVAQSDACALLLIGPVSGALPGLQAAHFPIALVDAAGFAAHPVFATAGAHIAGEEILAGEAVHIIGRSDGSDGAARAGLRVLPGLAHAITAAAKHFRCRGAGIGKITVIRLWLGRRNGRLAVLDGAGRFRGRLFLAFVEQRVELVGEA